MENFGKMTVFPGGFGRIGEIPDLARLGSIGLKCYMQYGQHTGFNNLAYNW